MLRLKDTPSHPQLKSHNAQLSEASPTRGWLYFQHFRTLTRVAAQPLAPDTFWIEVMQLEIDRRSSSASRKSLATLVA